MARGMTPTRAVSGQGWRQSVRHLGKQCLGGGIDPTAWDRIDLLFPAIRKGLEDGGGSPDSVCQDKIVADKRDKREVDDRLGMCKEKRKMGGFYVMLMSAVVGGSADRRGKLGVLGFARDK